MNTNSLHNRFAGEFMGIAKAYLTHKRLVAPHGLIDLCTVLIKEAK